MSSHDEPIDEKDVDARMERLRAALIEGEESGPAEEFDFDAFIAAKQS